MEGDGTMSYLEGEQPRDDVVVTPEGSLVQRAAA